MPDNGQVFDRKKPSIYECKPPDFLPKTSNSADLGFISFFPPRPSEDGDVLTETTIKHGFTLKNPVEAETYTFKTKQIKELKEDGPIHDLEDFMNQIFQRRAENLARIPSSTFRTPSRATLNDTKRSAWFTDLANPDVPLYKLSKSIPHGVRGNDLLDLLHSNNVAIPRAVWFVRVFGSNETAGLRNKPNYNPLQYSIEWANVMTGYLKKQLSEIALPSAPRPGLNIKQTFKGVLGDPDSRERWVSKFVYSLDLLRMFHSEFMVDHTTFLSWLVQMLASCNPAQASFMARLADNYLSDMGSCRALIKPFVDACLGKLLYVANSPSKETLEPLRMRIENLLRRAFLASPTAFVSPTMWKAHSETIKSILPGDDHFWRTPEGQAKQNIRLLIRETLLDVEKRNEALLFRTGAQPTKGYLRSMVFDVKLLNSITSTTDLSSVAFFPSRDERRSITFGHKLFLLLSWSVCYLQYGDHRPYAAATLLRHWRDKAEERACRRNSASPNDLIQDGLFDWLDTDEKAQDERNLPMTSLLFGELIEKGLFSYDQYIQRIIARGETGLSFNEELGSRHRMILREIPLYRSDPALVSQRKLALYGVRVRTIPEDQVERDLKNELQNLLPEVFRGEAALMPKSSVPPDSIIRNSARYEQIRVVKQWFTPNVRKFLVKASSESPENSTLLLRVYCVVIECLDAMKCLRTGLEFTLDVLRVTTAEDLLLAIVDNLKRGLILWVCMDVMPTIASALLEAHQAWKGRGVYIRCLMGLLLEIDDGRYLGSAFRQHVIEDTAHFSQILCPVDEAPDIVPSVLPEVFTLLQSHDPDAPSSLANSLWYKYRTSTNWTYVVWDNVVENLRQLTSMLSDVSEQRECSLRLAKFLLHIDLHSADGINGHVLQWFAGPGLNLVKPLSSEAWNVMNIVFLYLAVHGAIRIATLLQGIVYPAWTLGSSIEEAERFEENRVFMDAANTLCRLLLVEQIAVSEDGLPPSDLMEMQRLKTRRRDAYSDANFRLLAEHIPALVFIEHNEHIDDHFKVQTAELRCSLCSKADFRLAASRNVGIVVGAFANPLCCKVFRENLHEPLISALRLIFNDEEADDSASVTSLLSPWKLSATAAVTSFVLQQIGQRLESPATQEQAKTELKKLASRLMHHAITAQEADFVSEMAKGVSSEVAGAFVNKGLQRIAEIMDEISGEEPEALQALPVKAGHFLHLLSAIVQPFRHSPAALPQIEHLIQDSFIASLSVKLSALVNAIRDQIEAGNRDLVSLTDPVLFLARLLQFDLGFPGVWTQKMKDMGVLLMTTILRLAVIHGGPILNPVAFPLLMDTAFYVFDERPMDPRRSGDLFQHCPTLDSSYFPGSMPMEYRKLIKTLEKHTPHCPFTADLVYVTRDAEGHLQQGAPVQMRPWEWIESLGDFPPVDPKEIIREAEEKERRGSRYLVRNNTSIPLEMFGTRVVGEGVRHLGEGMELDVGVGKGEQVRSLFEDDLDAESIYERDWRESRVAFTIRGESSEDSGSRGDCGSGGGRPTPSSRRCSPSLSVHTSRGASSAAAGPPSATSSRRTHSPALAVKGEAMDIDPPLSAGGSAAGKRKASIAGLEDGEIAVQADNNMTRDKGKTTSTRTVSKTAGRVVGGKTTRKKK